jgi:hypothetical protein
MNTVSATAKPTRPDLAVGHLLDGLGEVACQLAAHNSHDGCHRECGG